MTEKIETEQGQTDTGAYEHLLEGVRGDDPFGDVKVYMYQQLTNTEASETVAQVTERVFEKVFRPVLQGQANRIAEAENQLNERVSATEDLWERASDYDGLLDRLYTRFARAVQEDTSLWDDIDDWESPSDVETREEVETRRNSFLLSVADALPSWIAKWRRAETKSEEFRTLWENERITSDAMIKHVRELEEK